MLLLVMASQYSHKAKVKAVAAVGQARPSYFIIEYQFASLLEEDLPMHNYAQSGKGQLEDVIARGTDAKLPEAEVIDDDDDDYLFLD